ncbi:hypothetical protein B7463_g12150, partial [Scytalidium lignicola]
MNIVQVQSQGIFHGLPVYPESKLGYNAIVTGANGISGSYMLRVLAESPTRWNSVFALSRRAVPIPPEWSQSVQSASLDFLQSPEAIAEVLKDNKAKAYVAILPRAMSQSLTTGSDYVFFFSYIQVKPKDDGILWSNAQGMCDVNGRLLENFLIALEIASITPKRFLLQTGAKTYGIHMGPIVCPQKESQPRILAEPSFYYLQEDLLSAYCERTGVEWNVIRPGAILGAVRDAAMNLLYPLAVYATVQAKMNAKLEFPGDMASWDREFTQSSAMMNGYLSEWAVLTPAARNEAFNAADTSPFTWGEFWPVLARWFNLPYGVPDVSGNYRETILPYSTPPRGYGPVGKLRYTWKFTDWAKKTVVQTTWAKLQKEHNLCQSPFEEDKVDQIFAFLDSNIACTWSLSFSMNKSRKLGWFGFVDSHEAMRLVMNELADLRMIPELPEAEEREAKY